MEVKVFSFSPEDKKPQSERETQLNRMKPRGLFTIPFSFISPPTPLASLDPRNIEKLEAIFPPIAFSFEKQAQLFSSQGIFTQTTPPQYIPPLKNLRRGRRT